jgi:hypothetical protein
MALGGRRKMLFFLLTGLGITLTQRVLSQSFGGVPLLLEGDSSP